MPAVLGVDSSTQSTKVLLVDADDAQQHGMVALDDQGLVVRPALLWNDVRSAGAAEDLVREWGGPQECARLVGSVLVASFTASKLCWFRARRRGPDCQRAAPT